MFQPRSNTSVTNVFQREWVEAFAEADCVVFAELHRLEQIPEAKRLSRQRLSEDLTTAGVKVFLRADADEITDLLTQKVQAGDVVLIMSNSDFGGLAGKLKTRLEKGQG